MKYQLIGTRVLGYLSPNTNVEITLVNIKDDNIVSTLSNVCSESNVLPGLYIFDSNSIIYEDLDDKYKSGNESLELAYIMTNELNEKYGGKLVIDNDLKLLISIDQAVTEIPSSVWNLLSVEEQLTYKQLLKRIYLNTDMIPALL